MKIVAILCAVVLVVEARPQTEPQVGFNVAVEFDKFHKLWLSEAKRNSIAPVSPFKTANNDVITSEPKPMVVDEIVVKEAVPVEAVVTVKAAAPVKEIQQNTPTKPVEVPDMNAAFANFQTLWAAEAARNAIAPRFTFAQATPTLKQSPQPVAPLKPVAVPNEQVSAPTVPVAIQEQSAPVVLSAEPAVVTPDHQAEFAAFHKLWEQEAARNAMAPVFQAQPTVPAVEPIPTPKAVIPAQPTPMASPIPASTNFGSQPIIIYLPNWSPTPAVL